MLLIHTGFKHFLTIKNYISQACHIYKNNFILQ